MPGALIRLGDKTSHGGAVMSASAMSDSGGIPIARVGDRVSCPLKGHAPCTIVTGDVTMLVDGQAVARDGDATSCGAVLIASQQSSIDHL